MHDFSSTASFRPLAGLSHALNRLAGLRVFFWSGLMCLVLAAPVHGWAQGAAGRGGGAGGNTASGPSSGAVVPPSGGASAAVSLRKWASVPRVIGHLTAKQLGLVINEDDPYSVEVGEYYAKARGIPANQVLRLKVPVKTVLTPKEFADLAKRIDAFYGDRVQALALAWRMPYAVDCNSITGALALGYDAKLCDQHQLFQGQPATCANSRLSSYFGSATNLPLKDHGMRISMLLAANDADEAKAMIDRGVRSDHTLGLRGGLPVSAHFVTTSDVARSVRQMFFPPAGFVGRFGVEVVLDQSESLKDVDRVLLYQTGRATVDSLETVRFVPGALADHLTSFGGKLDDGYGQMTALAWIHAGATASYGSVTEPCAHPQKFPHPQALLLFYIQGATAIEAYWKSVAWPQQGLFVGEPLAAPFSR